MAQTTLSLEDFRSSGTEAARRAADFAATHDLSDPAACSAFNALVKEAEAVADTAFRCATLLARKADGMDDVAALWREMERVCDDVLDELRRTSAANGRAIPLTSCDRILDLRLAANERASLHTA